MLNLKYRKNRFKVLGYDKQKIVILKSNINYKTQSHSNENFIIKIFKN